MIRTRPKSEKKHDAPKTPDKPAHQNDDKTVKAEDKTEKTPPPVTDAAKK